MTEHHEHPTQSTQSAFERARSRSVSWLHAAQDGEANARHQLTLATKTTANAIFTARQHSMPWAAIGDALGGMSRTAANKRLAKAGLKRPGMTRKNEDEWPGDAQLLTRCLEAEHAAHKRLEQAVHTTAATIAVARTIGLPWDTLAEATGITRKNQLARLAKAFDGDSLQVPDASKAAEVSQEDFVRYKTRLTGQAADLWRLGMVFSAVRDGVSTAVRNRLAAHLNSGDETQPGDVTAVVADLEAVRTAALAAAAKALDDMKLAGLTPDDRETAGFAATAALRAAALVGGNPMGQAETDMTVFRPQDVDEAVRQLNQPPAP